MTLTIRPARDEDIAAITAIYAEQVLKGTASFELTPPSEAEMAGRRATILAAGLPYLVAELEAAPAPRIAGYAYAGPYRPRPAYENTVENSVYVDRDCRGKGVGRALLAALVDACEKAGKRQMIAVIGDSANRPSIALHAALGFHHAGTLENVGFKHGKWLDSVLMQRALGEGAESPPATPSHS